MEQLAAQSPSCCYRVISSGWLAQKRRVFPRYFSTAVGAEPFGLSAPKASAVAFGRGQPLCVNKLGTGGLPKHARCDVCLRYVWRGAM